MREKHLFGEQPSRRLVLFTILCGSALFGALFGTMCCVRSETALGGLLISYRQSVLERRLGGEYLKAMLSSLAENGAFIAAAMMLGLSAVSQPLEVILPFIRGVGLGAVLTGAVSGGLCRGTLMTAAAVVPEVFCSLIVTVLACREALFFSGRLAAVVARDGILDGMAQRSKLFAARSAGLFAVSAAVSAVSAAVCRLVAVYR